MRVEQSPLDELAFFALIETTDETKEHINMLWEYYNVSSGLARTKRLYHKAVQDYHQKCFRYSLVFMRAQQLDAKLRFAHRGGRNFTILFTDRGSAAVFKLTYC